jgi:hypothetical protein
MGRSNKTAMDKHSKGNRHIFATFHCECSKYAKISPNRLSKNPLPLEVRKRKVLNFILKHHTSE